MRSWISKGQCQKCQAREVIAHCGHKHVCQRCDPELWSRIGQEQKERFLATGSVHDNMHKKVQKSFDNRAKILRNIV